MEQIVTAFTVSIHSLQAAYIEIVRALHHFRLNLMGVLQGPDMPIPTTTLPKIFDSQFNNKDFGDKVALIMDGKLVTFAELKDKSEAFALKLYNQFESNGKCHLPRVFGLFTIPGEPRIAAILALLKLKRGYLPIDFTQPPERIAAILQDAGVEYVIHDDKTTGKALQRVTAINYAVKGITMDGLLSNTEINTLDSDPSAPTENENDDPLVCVLYTSGSTGAPKGVEIHTNNVLNRLTWQWSEVPFMVNDIGCHKTCMLFVDSMNEILSCLLKGIPLVILKKEQTAEPEPFIQAISKFQISRLVLVPSHLNMLINHLKITRDLDKLFSIRTVISSGEPLPVEMAKSFFTIFPLCATLYNFYGSTETTGDVTYEKWDSVEDVEGCCLDGVMSLGTPLYNTCAVILNNKGEQCKEGSIGYVYISGHNIPAGYTNTTRIKSEVFTPNGIFTKQGHGTLYKMGDLGIIKNGRLYHQGRSDEHVKVLGRRVDLYEISKIVKAVPHVESCQVLPYRDINGYIVPVVFYQSKQIDTESTINEACKKKLPNYAMPRLMHIAKFPLQPHTAKVDRQKLVQLYRERILSDKTMKGTGVESRFAQIPTVLARNLSIPIDDLVITANFFDNGGNSLSAVAVVADLHSEGIDIAMSDFLRLKSLKELIESDSRTIPAKQIYSLGHRYQAVMLNSVNNKDQAIGVLARGFTQKNPLEVLAGTTEQSFERFLQSFWTEIMKDDLSVVVVDKSTMHIVAAYIVLDLNTKIIPVVDVPQVAAVNEAVEAPVRRKLLKSGKKWVDALLNAVDPTVKDNAVLALLEMMEEYVIQTVRKRGYDGILTVNSHPVTMAMAENQFGFITMNSVHVRSFCYHGTYPFKDAEDTYVIKAMVKHLTE